jgi:hypothetical protein
MRTLPASALSQRWVPTLRPQCANSRLGRLVTERTSGMRHGPPRRRSAVTTLRLGATHDHYNILILLAYFWLPSRLCKKLCKSRPVSNGRARRFHRSRGFNSPGWRTPSPGQRLFAQVLGPPEDVAVIRVGPSSLLCKEGSKGADFSPGRPRAGLQNRADTSKMAPGSTALTNHCSGRGPSTNKVGLPLSWPNSV